MKFALVVDDSSFQRKHLVDLLNKTKLFYRISEASDPEEAVKICVKLNPELILMDYDMPRMDGLTGSKMIFGIKRNANIIMVTAKDRRNIRKRALQIGIKDVITKPYTEVTVIKAVLESMAPKSKNDS